MHSTLTNSPLFKGIAPEEIENIFRDIQFKVRKYSADQLIASREEPVNNLLILLKGSVRGEMLDFSGKVLKVEDIHAPKPIVGAFLFGSQNKFPVDVITCEETTLLLIPKESVINLFQLNHQFLQNFLNAISNRAQFLSRRIWFLSFKTIKGKLAQYILNLEKAQGDTINLKLTQKELAEFFGVTRPSLARALGEMEKSGLIKVSRKDVTILDKNKLIQIIE